MKLIKNIIKFKKSLPIDNPQQLFAPITTAGMIVASVLLFFPFFNRVVPDARDPSIAAMPPNRYIPINATEAISPALSMPIAFPLIGLFIIATLVSWLVHFKAIPLKKAYKSFNTIFAAIGLFLIESYTHYLWGFQYGTVNTQISFWIQSFIVLSFIIYGTALLKSSK